MKIVQLPEILAALDDETALAAVENGLRRFSVGEAQAAEVGHLAFSDPPGDCHVKNALRNLHVLHRDAGDRS